MRYRIRIYDELGSEIPEYRAVIVADSYAEAERIADEYEDHCYDQDSTVDWYEIDTMSWWEDE